MGCVLSSELLEEFSDKSISKEALYSRVEENIGLLPELFRGVSSPKASVRYGCGKILVDLSANHPEKVYPYINEFFALLESQHRILTWNALAAIANLAVVDSQKKFDAKFDKYFGFLNNEYMVTVANVAGTSGKIALAKPYLIPRITTELLKVENVAITPHLTEECKRVIAEHAIKSFNTFFDKLDAEQKTKVLAFVMRHAKSSRRTLQVEAEKFLKKWNK
jgi:hypothetical protein